MDFTGECVHIEHNKEGPQQLIDQWEAGIFNRGIVIGSWFGSFSWDFKIKENKVAAAT